MSGGRTLVLAAHPSDATSRGETLVWLRERAPFPSRTLQRVPSCDTAHPVSLLALADRLALPCVLGQGLLEERVRLALLLVPRGEELVQVARDRF